jgi:hypothetical protein
VVFPSRAFWASVQGYRLERAQHTTADVARAPTFARRAGAALRAARRGEGWRQGWDQAGKDHLVVELGKVPGP